MVMRVWWRSRTRRRSLAAAIDSALKPASAAWTARVDAALGQNSWDRTWRAMDAEMDRLLSAKRSARVARQPSLPQIGLLQASQMRREPGRCAGDCGAPSRNTP